MEVIFRNYDGSAEEIRNVVPDSTLRKYREALKMLLGLPEKQHCKFFLERNNQEIDVNLTFEDAGIQPNDTLILSSPNRENINSSQESFSSSPEDTIKDDSPTSENEENINSSEESSQKSVSSSPKDTTKADSRTPTAVKVLARLQKITRFKEWPLKKWKKPAIAGGIIVFLILIWLIITRTSSQIPDPLQPQSGESSSSKSLSSKSSSSKGEKKTLKSKQEMGFRVWGLGKIEANFELPQQNHYISNLIQPSRVDDRIASGGNLQGLPPSPPTLLPPEIVPYPIPSSAFQRVDPSVSLPPNQSYTPPESPLSEQDAVNVIRRWQKAKGEIFAPPFNRQLGSKVLTGKAYRDNIRRTDNTESSVDWLENNDAYYTYGVQSIDQVNKFAASGDRATIEVTISEDRTLYVNGKPSRDKHTAFDTSVIRYTLHQEEGEWKIAEYKIFEYFPE